MSDPSNESREQTPEELQAHIERTRADLAATVDALGAKTDVKARTKNAVTTDDGKPDPKVIAAATLVVLAVAGLVVWRRRGRD